MGGGFVNRGNDTETSIALTLAPGTYTYALYGESTGPMPVEQHFVLNPDRFDVVVVAVGTWRGEPRLSRAHEVRFQQVIERPLRPARHLRVVEQRPRGVRRHQQQAE